MTAQHSGTGASAVSDFLDVAARRAQQLSVLQGAAIGALAAALAELALLIAVLSMSDRTMVSPLANIGVATALVAAGALAGAMRTRRVRETIAQAVERRAPACRNLLVTADELQRTADGETASGTSPEVALLVQAQGAALVRSMSVPVLFPAKRAVRQFTGALLVLAVLGVLQGAPDRARSVADSVRRAATPATFGIDRIETVTTAPAYSGRASVRATNPERIIALAGSQLRVEVRTGAAYARIATASDTTNLVSNGGVFRADLPVSTDGFVVVEVFDTLRTLDRRLIGVTAERDRSPRVRIVAPANDLVLRDSAQTIPLSVEADDDLALSTLRLRYTKVSGSGERFTFAEGEVPLALTRTSERVWNARANWRLASLGLVAGDMVVYRAVAGDRRPGAVPTESDAFIAQLLATEGDAAAGFAVDPDEDRQALSQQMVIVKTERLIARQRTLAPEAFVEEARNLAVEQRRVRAEFVFMMGGELAEAVASENSMDDLDELHEAEGESDLSAGRMANQGRTALLAAIRAMSRAAAALAAGEVARALPEERNAVTQLERAFSRSRYLLRALTQREQLDLTRRGSGDLAGASRDVRPAAAASRDERIVALRSALASLVQLGQEIDSVKGSVKRSVNGGVNGSVNGRGDAQDAVADRVSEIAERVLRTDPSSRGVQALSDSLSSAARALRGTRGGAERNSARAEARRTLDRAAASLAALLRNDSRSAQGAPGSPEQRRLSGLLSDELQARGTTSAQSRPMPRTPRP